MQRSLLILLSRWAPWWHPVMLMQVYTLGVKLVEADVSVVEGGLRAACWVEVGVGGWGGDCMDASSYLATPRQTM